MHKKIHLLNYYQSNLQIDKQINDFKIKTSLIFISITAPKKVEKNEEEETEEDKNVNQQTASH